MSDLFNAYLAKYGTEEQKKLEGEERKKLLATFTTNTLKMWNPDGTTDYSDPPEDVKAKDMNRMFLLDTDEELLNDPRLSGGPCASGESACGKNAFSMPSYSGRNLPTQGTKISGSQIEQEWTEWVKENEDFKRKLTTKYSLEDDNLLGAIRDQGSCGTCASFSAVAALEPALRHFAKTKYSFSEDKDMDLSEQHVFNCAENGELSCERGMWVEWGFDLLRRGAASEVELPYTLVPKPRKGTCDLRYNNRKYISEVVEPENPDQLKKALMMYKTAISITLSAGKGFMRWRPANGAYDCKETWDNYAMHQVNIVGFTEDAWIVRNSWGISPVWGRDGYIEMKIKECPIAFGEPSNGSKILFPLGVKVSEPARRDFPEDISNHFGNANARVEIQSVLGSSSISKIVASTTSVLSALFL